MLTHQAWLINHFLVSKTSIPHHFLLDSDHVKKGVTKNPNCFVMVSLDSLWLMAGFLSPFRTRGSFFIARDEQCSLMVRKRVVKHIVLPITAGVMLQRKGARLLRLLVLLTVRDSCCSSLCHWRCRPIMFFWLMSIHLSIRRCTKWPTFCCCLDVEVCQSRSRSKSFTCATIC